ncbi:dual oxidase 2-like isoform X1 [Clavelina lepadiformis]|uniref:dual oxidase 2-like isoform X1 n=1 Tax=Clavelina lepadiformis TaxID=159417 RepID=UPI0040422BDA
MFGIQPTCLVAIFTLVAAVTGQESVFGGGGYEEKEYHPYDGWFNNRAHPEWGVVEGPLTRRVESHYADGTYAPSGGDRPNPRSVSEETMSGLTGEGSYVNRTALLVFFGQQVVEEILDAQRPGCPPEYFNIPIPKGDPLYDKEGRGDVVLPFLRSRYDMSITGYNPNQPRQQLNEITPFIDGGLTYGVSKAWADALRLLKSNCSERSASNNLFASQDDPQDCRGELASYKGDGRFPVENSLGLPLANPPPPRDHQLKSATRFFRLGNPRGNENPFLLTFGILWFRHHNWLAREFRKHNSDWSDEKVYNEARAMNIAIHQKIVLYDWLPLLLGSCEGRTDGGEICLNVTEYDGYKSAIHPGVTHVFQSAAMRWGHTLVPPGVYRRTGYNETSGTCEFLKTTRFTAGDRHDFVAVHENKPGLRTCNTYWNSLEAIQETDIDTMLMGMASQISEREDNIITPDLRGNVFGPLEFSRRDLMALNIQRGRDHGLPDYNTARRAFGLQEKQTFEEINPTLFNTQSGKTERANGTGVLERLKQVHNNTLSKVDVWTGGLLETQQGGPGELFRAIIRDQFLRIRDGDRFWFENTRNGLFSSSQLSFIWNTTIRDVILRTNPSMKESDIQGNPFQWRTGDSNLNCPQPDQLSELDMENCTDPEYFDYFSGSEVSYALTFTSFGLFIIATLLFLIILGKQNESKRKVMKKRAAALTKKQSTQQSGDDYDIATEILGKKSREITIKLGPGKLIQIKTVSGRKLRTIDLSKSDEVLICRSYSKERTEMFLRVSDDTHDLVLNFNDSEERDSFVVRAKTFLQENNIRYNDTEVSSSQLMGQASTKEMRDKLLQRFFKTALAASVKLETDEGESLRDLVNSKEARKFIHVELSKREFAEYLKLKPDSLFVEQMFSTADTDQSGAISFREFLDIMVLFTKGSPDDKAKLMFNMYDLDKSGELSVDEFRVMLKSMMEMVSTSVESEQLDDLVNTMMTSHGFGNKTSLTLNDFNKIMSKYSTELSDASLHVPVGNGDQDGFDRGIDKQRQQTVMHAAPARENRALRARRTVRAYAEKRHGDAGIRQRADRKSRVQVKVTEAKFEKNEVIQWWQSVQKYIQNYRLEIFWLSLYLLVLAGIFIERAYYYSVEREFAGLRRIAGYGVSITRGAASAMMFTYCSILVTMCRNTITALRETFLHRYIPFDSAVTMHKIIAWLALVFTVMHIIGHSLNIYAISTQPAGDLTCLFRDYWRPSDELPKFHYWCWQTLTGITGVLLTLIIIVMYIFASDYSRQRVFKWFWWTHNFGYFGVYFFMVFHGSGFLVQDPFFYYFFLGPGILYTLDKLYSVSRSKTEIAVVKAELLPSEVTYLEFKRPSTFDYKAGQWVRIACLSQSPSEYHPFTLTSAPSEDTLKLHIRAVGPWTINLRNIYNPEVLRDSPYPKLYLDGPFGEGHQDWYKFDVSVLVGGGIGVTPFASILKDLIATAQSGVKIACKKVYFMWITRDQNQYEWLTDIIQEVEGKDTNGVLDTHIFITQFPQKFDLRTTMLYICERHFQKVAGKSLFTGLRAVTHFGRPEFKSFFASLPEEHPEVTKFGVFSCGPPPMTNGVDKTCSELNKYEGPSFLHHFENF